MDFNYALIDCVHVYGLLLGFYEDNAFVLLFHPLCIIVLCMCCLSGLIKNNSSLKMFSFTAVGVQVRLWRNLKLATR